MAKAQQLYVKHLYAAGEDQEEDSSKPVEDVVINEISKKFENHYRGRKDDFRDSLNNRRDNYDQDQRKWQNYDSHKNFGDNSSKRYQQQTPMDMDKGSQLRFDTMTNRQELTLEQASNQQQGIDHQPSSNDRVDDSTRRQSRGNSSQSSVLHGGYTQIMVNPVQLSDAEFTNWMEKLVEARRN